MSIGTSECFTSLDHYGTGLKGVEGEAGALSNKPLGYVVEVSFTRANGGPVGHNNKKGSNDVQRLRRRREQTAAFSSSPRKGTPAAHGWKGGGLSQISLYHHAQASD